MVPVRLPHVVRYAVLCGHSAMLGITKIKFWFNGFEIDLSVRSFLRVFVRTP